MNGGEGGIRTPDTLSGMPVFKTGVFNRSTTSPNYYSFTTVFCVAAGMNRRGLFRSVWVNQYLAGFARFQSGHGFRKILHRDAVGNHRMKIEASALQQSGHLIPGLVHAAPIDALNGDAFKNDVFGEIERNGLRRKAEERDAPAASHDVECGSNGIGMAGHFKNYVHTEASSFFGNNGTHVFFGG